MALTNIDRDLLKRCIAGDPSGWKDFVDRFLPLVIHVVQHSATSRSLRISSSDIDDFCADVFLAVLASDYAVLRNFRGQSSLATYLAVVARRVVVREMSRRRMVEQPLPAGMQVHAESKDQQRIENRDEVHRMLEGLPETEAQIVRQFHLEGRSYREISSGLGVPENSIGPTLTRAHAKIRHRHEV